MKKENKDITRLIEILKTCKNKKDYNGKKRGVRLTFTDLQPSKSGMSRKFKIYVINRDGETLNITWLVAKILKETYTQDDCMRVYGCGMDMLFNTCYNINCAIQNYKSGKYDHDKAYHGWVDTSYNLL